ncbi:MAG: NUDIX hydrolase [Hyphomicrobiaceae bacterium]|jgi:hypothetical protein|nr:NUDIX hydrolase [Hyphomicrobiaceae bacterium]
MPTGAKVVHVQSHVLRVVDEAWPFSIEASAQIANHWQRRVEQNPSFFNGRIHLLRQWELLNGHFSGELLKTDFASFLYWREHEYPDRSVRDCFGSALLRSSDGQIILGRQSPGHINSGLTYFPGGFIDHRDVAADGTVDVAGSVAREIAEELGFPDGTFAAVAGAYLTFDGQLLSIAIDHVSAQDAVSLTQSASRFIASEPDSELEAVVAVATPADYAHLAMPDFTKALLDTILA